MSAPAPPAPAAPENGARPTQRPAATAATALLLPLFFVIVFPLAFVSALHKPTPHDLPLLVVGPSAVVAPIAEGLDGSSEFAATHTDVSDEARTRVADRTVDGAIEVVPDASDPAADADPDSDDGAAPSFTVTTYIAQAEGLAVASAVQAAGAQVASDLGTDATVVDVAPLAATDTLGSTLFYLFTYTTLGSYLVIIVLTQVLPDAALRLRYLASAIAAVVAPLVVFGLSTIWVGDYDASFRTIAALLGVNALYVFTIGAAAILVQQFLGRSATFGIMTFVVFLNFPSAGGASPAALLPPFWQFIHSFYFGAGAFESFRSIVYFGGEGAGRWLLQLSVWTLALVLTTVVVHLQRTARHQRRVIAGLTATLAHEPSTGQNPPPALPAPATNLPADPSPVDDGPQHAGPGAGSHGARTGDRFDTQHTASPTSGEGTPR